MTWAAYTHTYLATMQSMVCAINCGSWVMCKLLIILIWGMALQGALFNAINNLCGWLRRLRAPARQTVASRPFRAAFAPGWRQAQSTVTGPGHGPGPALCGVILALKGGAGSPNDESIVDAAPVFGSLWLISTLYRRSISGTQACQ